MERFPIILGIAVVVIVIGLSAFPAEINTAPVRDSKAHRAVGIEIDAQLIRVSRENAEKAGVADRVEFFQGDLFTTDFKEANVVTLFLGHEPNLGLHPMLISLLKPGSRIVSHQFGMGEWAPDKSLTVRTLYLGMLEFAIPSLFTYNPRVPDLAGNESEYGSSDV